MIRELHAAVALVAVTTAGVACARNRQIQAPRKPTESELQAERADLMKCVGPARASVGPIFGTLKFGPAVPVPAVPQLPAILVVFDGYLPDPGRPAPSGNVRVEGVTVIVSDDEVCTGLADHLDALWGPRDPDTGDGPRWDDPTGHQRAELEIRPCVLRIHRLVPATEWLSFSKQAVVPLWAIGRPTDELRAALAPFDPTTLSVDRDSEQITWTDLSIDGDDIQLVADAEDGLVARITATLKRGDEGARRRIEKLFGRPAQDSAERSQWNAKFGEISFERHADADIATFSVKHMDTSAAIAASLARCCGTERATLGPLFGTLTLIDPTGALGSAAMSHGLPTYLRRSQVGLEILPMTGEGPDGTHLDGVRIRIPDHDRCAQLEKRLEKLWGPRAEWSNPARQQAADLEWSVDTTACDLVFVRIGSSDAARCLADEKPDTSEIDIQHRCVKRARARGCVLDRARPGPYCIADVKHHMFWKINRELADGEHSCTAAEEKQLDYTNLPECK